MRPNVVALTLCICAFAVFSFALDTSATLAEADKLMQEHSYQLALGKYSELQEQATTLPSELKREITYKLGLAYTHVDRWDEARKALKSLVSGDERDVWAGRAHWRLEPALSGHGAFSDAETSPLEHLREADAILSKLKPPDLAEFYSAVAFNAAGRAYLPDEKDRTYIFSFFDKLMPLLKDKEEIARVLHTKAMHTGYVSGKPDEQERLRQLRQIVSEFPETKTAAKAQMDLAQYFLARSELPGALKELGVITKNWPRSEEGKNAAKLAEEIGQEQVIVSLSQSYLPEDPIKFELRGRNVTKVTLSLIPFDITKELRRQKRERMDLSAISGNPAHQFDVTLPKRDDHLATATIAEINYHERGAYVLKAEAGKARAFALLLISDLMLVSNSSASALELWAVDAKTGHPRPGVQMTVAAEPKERRMWFARQDERFFTKFYDLLSDANGFADVTAKLGSSGQYFVAAREGMNFAFLGRPYWYPSSQSAEPVTYIYTDRPVYRPNQKVGWRAVVRMRETGEFRNVAGKKFHLRIMDPQGNDVVAQTDTAANEFGALSGELTLKDRAPLGQYMIQLQMLEAPGVSGVGNFRVEEYKKPEYEVEVATAERLYRIGGRVKAEVSARYYFGAPAADAQVQYTVRRRPHWFSWWRSSFGGSALSWFDREPQDRGPHHGSQGDVVSTGNGRTDSAGKFSFEFKADVPPALPALDGPYWRWGRPYIDAYDFQIEVTVTDKSRRNIDASRTIVVGGRALQVNVSPEQHLYTPGDLAKVELQARNFNDDPVSATGSLSVVRVRWDAKTGKEELTTLTTQRADIPDSGSLITSWRIPQDEIGQIRFVAEMEDPFGGISPGFAEITSADERAKDIFYKYQGLQIITDRDTYEVGETARVMILCEHPDMSVWYWIDSGSGNIGKRVLPLSSRTTFVQVPITDALVPNSMVHVVGVRDKQVLQDQKELIVPPKRKVMTVEIRPDRDSFRPGQEGSIRISAKDYAGKPVRAEFSLAMFDRSILYIAPEERDDIRHAFYGQRRALRAEIQNSAAEPGSYNSHDPDSGDEYLYRTPPGQTASYDEKLKDRDFSAVDAEGRLAGNRGQLAGGLGGAALRKAAAMPASAPPPAPSMRALGMAETAAPAAMSGGRKGDAPKEEKPLLEAKVRTDFRDSMFWSPSVVTNEDGQATLKVAFPDSLTTWKAVAVGTDTGALVGNDSTETVVKKNLLIRMEAPRFFRERDSVTLSGIVHNYLEQAKKVHVRMSVAGLSAAGGESSAPLEKLLHVGAGSETRADWTVDAKQWGEAVIRMEALTDEESDAVEMKFPVLAHGIDKFVAWNGSSDTPSTAGLEVELSGERTAIVQQVEIPAERIHASTKLTVLVNPSLASAIRDAIPYLIDYPYGCVEQTMSRFMPAAVVSQTFHSLNLPRDTAQDAKLEEVIRQGLERLAAYQHVDGGWGWWRDDETNDYMTAYVMHGLTLARSAGCPVDSSMFSRGMQSIRQRVSKFGESGSRNSWYWRYNDLHALAFQLYVMALNNERAAEALEHVWTRRDDLAPQGLAMLARTLWRSDRKEDARVVLRNLHNHAVVTQENGTTRWGRLQGAWYWWDDAVEATAQGLAAYLEIAPQDPAAGRAMKWLVLNRSGSRWKSSKDTALAVLALAGYMKDRKEDVTSMTLEVSVGKLPAKKIEVTPENFWSFDGRLLFEGDAVPDGQFPVRITKSGSGTLFYNVYAEYFTLEENIKKAGNEIFVERRYEKLVREQVKSTTGVVAVESYVPVHEGDLVKSGDELRVTLKIRSLNDYEYLIFEDPKPAGMEPVALQSGGSWSGIYSYMELRDQFVAFFITHLPQGEREITYNCRAEIPGTFHTMPTKGYAMYFPPLRANSDELVVHVKDAE